MAANFEPGCSDCAFSIIVLNAFKPLLKSSEGMEPESSMIKTASCGLVSSVSSTDIAG